MKKTVSSILSILLIYTLAISVFAAPTPRWANIFMVSPGIAAGSNLYTTDVYGNPGTSQIDCTMVLYEKGFWGNYNEVSRKSETSYDVAEFFSNSYTFISGKTYKMEATVTVYIKGIGETTTQSIEKKSSNKVTFDLLFANA